MFPIQPCPEWEYAHHSDRQTILESETRQILLDLRSGTINTLELTPDTRPIHLRLFENLVPPPYNYYAGNYRGSSFRCLIDRYVMVGNSMCCPPHLVSNEVTSLSSTIISSLSNLDTIFSPDTENLSIYEKLKVLVSISASIFSYFLVIHPYLNGNGHIARFIVWSFLGRYGYWINNWPIEPRPDDPPYSNLVQLCINGDPEPLEKYILRRLVN